MKLVRVCAVIETAERSAEPVAFDTQRGTTVVSLRDNGNLVFHDVKTGAFMYQDLFLDRFRHDVFTKSDTVPEIQTPTDSVVYPELDEVIDWVNDPDTTNDQLQAYLADVVGEDDRKRKRETNVSKIVEYVESQD